MHPETIADNLRAFDRGETVIESRRSAVTVGVAPDAHVPPGLVWLPVHNPAANRLTLSAADPVGRRAEPQAVRGRVACPGPDHHRYHRQFGTTERDRIPLLGGSKPPVALSAVLPRDQLRRRRESRPDGVRRRSRTSGRTAVDGYRSTPCAI